MPDKCVRGPALPQYDFIIKGKKSHESAGQSEILQRPSHYFWLHMHRIHTYTPAVGRGQVYAIWRVYGATTCSTTGMTVRVAFTQ